MLIERLRKDDFYLPILKLLDDLGGSASVEEMNAKVVNQFDFTPADLAATYPKSGALIVPDKISWARSYLKLGGLLSKEKRGVWVTTEAGRAAAQVGEAAVASIVSAAIKQYNIDYKAARSAASDSLSDAAAPTRSDDEQLGGDEQSWADELLARMQSIEPAAFERLCQRLLRENGFTSVQVTGKSGDGGIDGQGVLRVQLVSFHVLFQCKRYSGSVAAGAVRDFRGAMQGRADKGLIITTGTFTPAARAEATRDGAPAIDLIDGEALCELLRDKELGVSVTPVTTIEVRVDEAFFRAL